MTPANDFLGRTIKAGDTVVYPVRRGSKLWLAKLSVTQVLDDSIIGFNHLGKRITVHNLKNVVVAQREN